MEIPCKSWVETSRGSGRKDRKPKTSFRWVRVPFRSRPFSTITSLGFSAGRNRLAVGSADNSSPALFSAPPAAMFMLMFMLEWRKMIQCGLQAVPGLRLHRVDTLNQEQSGNCDKAANANTDTIGKQRQSWRVGAEFSFHILSSKSAGDSKWLHALSSQVTLLSLTADWKRKLLHFLIKAA